MFPERDSFIKLFEDGKLAKPDDVARIILKTLFSNSILTGSVVTIDQLKEIGI